MLIYNLFCDSLPEEGGRGEGREEREGVGRRGGEERGRVEEDEKEERREIGEEMVRRG